MSDRAADFIEQVRDARAAGTSLEIMGGGSKKFLGRAVSADTVLDTSGHRGIVSYEPVELVLTARAGTPLREIENALAQHGQVLAFEPPYYGDNATIGGTLACNQSGPARPWAGSMRDAVLGIRLINGAGEHLRFGGQVMKNVAGYDVSRAQAGALGSLGLITEVSLKVLPRPAQTLTLVQEMDAASAVRKMNELAGQPRPLSGACWQDGRLYLRLAGVPSAVAGTVERWGGEVLEHDAGFWNELKEQRQAFFAGDAALWRFSINSAAALWRPDDDWLIDWGGAQRWLRGDYPLAELERQAALAGGQVSLFRGGDRSGEVFATLAPAVQLLQRRLKTAFDPGGVFNPGRLYSWM